MKLTAAERKRIRTWLNKDPQGPDGLQNTLTFELDCGRKIRLARHTAYLPGNQWKMRIAYYSDTFIPTGDVSQPIPASKDALNKAKKNGKKIVMTEKFSDEPVSQLLKSNESFVKVVDNEIKNLYKSIIKTDPSWWGNDPDLKMEDEDE